MNIKISVKDCECRGPANRRLQFSETDQKKHSMLYAPPQKDNKKTVINTQSKQNAAKTQPKSRVDRNNQKYKESEKMMLAELQKAGKNQASLDIIHNTNKIVQNQNEMLEENQKNINEMMKQKQKKNIRNADVDERERNALERAVQKMNEEVKEIKKIREDMVNMMNEFNRNISNAKGSKPSGNVNLPQMNNANENFRDLISVSKNHLEGLQNLEAVKSLQNFNVEQYTQAINTIKRQIAQYQKESESIERQLRIRAAKLQKLEVPPNFQKQLLEPYQNHLNQKINAIDLHSVKERVYEKLGNFDYGKFEYDIGSIMIEAKSELGNFNLICHEYKINAPDIKIDTKELKQLQLRIPSVLDEYKAAKGIVFEQKKQNTKNLGNKQKSESQTDKLKRTHEIKQIMSKPKQGKNIKKMVTQPIDKSSNVRLTKLTDPPKTILLNEEKREKKQLEEKMRKTSRQKKKQDAEFEKYLENRAREQLQEIYKQRKRKLQRMQHELNDYCNQPTYIDLNLTKQDVKKEHIKRQQIKHQEQKEQYEDEFQRQQDEQIKRENEKKEVHPLKQLGKDVLKEKLKNIMKNRKKEEDNPRRQLRENGQGMQVQNVAEGVINLINNTLAQVNSNLATTIQRKMRLSEEKKPSFERKSPKKIQIPKLQQFRSPPVFTMGIAMNQNPKAEQSTQKKENKKIQLKNYDHLNIDYEKDASYDYEDESFDDLRVSDMNE